MQCLSSEQTCRLLGVTVCGSENNKYLDKNYISFFFSNEKNVSSVHIKSKSENSHFATLRQGELSKAAALEENALSSYVSSLIRPYVPVGRQLKRTNFPLGSNFFFLPSSVVKTASTETKGNTFRSNLLSVILLCLLGNRL